MVFMSIKCVDMELMSCAIKCVDMVFMSLPIRNSSLAMRALTLEGPEVQAKGSTARYEVGAAARGYGGDGRH